MPFNTRSARLLGKLDFTEKGLAEKYLRINGIREDHVPSQSSIAHIDFIWEVLQYYSEQPFSPVVLSSMLNSVFWEIQPGFPATDDTQNMEG
ncbi:hypothetical protein [Marinimicrobium agarilyticum]|uniref:hypothetical protein n=1 Tax=Marinimicrobium agarilyticum TaxID=306546 RepID=UPI0003F8A4E6|nr:hypothetical protein [Marinimicrobium agarilyticum]